MRAWARWGVTPLLAAPLGAWALGFGDIELQSALNQPFRAQIELIATPEELQGLHVSLAAPETFARYGLDRPEFLTDLEFRVTTNAAGRAVVQVSSQQSVAEPFVTLLVEANHARGKAFKEFTVLLDPPVLLPAPAAPQTVAPAETRPAVPSTSSGPISRPTPEPARAAPPASESAPAPDRDRAPEPAPRTRPEPAPAPRSTDTPPRAIPTSAPDGTYGPVQRAETLWAIAQQFRPDGVSMNQMMVAVYRANPQAFGGNMNVLHIGATLRLPDSGDFQELTTAVATTEVQRQTDEWLNRTPSQRTLRLLPPAEEVAAAAPSPAPAPAQSTSGALAPTPPPAAESTPPPASVVANAESEQSRLLALRNEELRNLQEQAAAPAPATPDAGAEPTQTAPGVDLEVETEKEPEQLFADEETPAAESPAPATEIAPPAQPPAATQSSAPQEPSLVSQILGFVMTPILWIGVGVAALLLTALWYVRRRRQEPDDVTGRWEALESEVADDEVREATARMRRQVPDESFVVEEQAQPARREADEDEASEESRPAATARTARIERAPLPPTDETMSSQTVINLDQADPVAEADFHMAYGLYDQAAELVQKALEAAPNRRDLKLKLLEVYFVWGNKDAFLTAAQHLRKEIGQKADADWDKVVIMGKQICPDERLFAEATSAAGQVDVDLEAGGDAPLDLAFDETSAGSVDLDFGQSEAGAFDLEATGTRGATAAVAKGSAKSSVKAPPAAKASSKSLLDEGLDIGERTAAGLEKAFLDLGDDEGQEEEDDRASQTAPDLRIDDLAITQESPTVERESRMSGMSTMELASADAPTVETPTIESVAHNAPTVETRKVERPRGSSIAPESTAEIDLDDLGLDVKDLEDLPHDLGDLPTSSRSETDTREQPVLEGSDDVLSATGVTQVLHGDLDDEIEHRPTAVLSDEDATLLAPSVDDGTLTGTEVLEERFEFDQSGDTSLVKSLGSDDNLDLNLDDLSAALHGADTVEQPRTGTFTRDVFSGGSTPLDLDVGADAVGVDDPTGTEEVSPLDPQTMTEVGTKLDLARAYIDMGDPEGARSILEEVLDEGDPNQRREAQSLIDVLTV
jgi:pilus assembly protein FimV